MIHCQKKSKNPWGWPTYMPQHVSRIQR